MDVLVTGAFGRVGTAILDHLGGSDDYAFTAFDLDPPESGPYADVDAVEGDAADYEALAAATEGQDAVVHLAGVPAVDASWEAVLENNVVGMQNALQAAREAGVESFVFASSNHAVGGYETDHAPALYEPGYGLVLDHESERRPDSFYGTSKAFGEDLGRQYVDLYDAPERFYALRIGSVRHPEYDHPYGDAERMVEEGELERGSEAYERWVKRMKATWHSRRDLAHLVDCCLRDDSVTHGVFSGVSANQRRWFDIEHARATVGYDPQDDGETFDAPPE
ncbi:MAG: NAD-dependent epimerase/dehydratase family protein [Halobacteriaceae archaeon]